VHTALIAQLAQELGGLEFQLRLVLGVEPREALLVRTAAFAFSSTRST